MDREANIFSNLRLFFAGKQKKVNNIFQKYGSGIWLSIVTCFMLFLYAPLELLFLNQDEFWYDAYLLIPIMFFVFCCGMCGQYHSVCTAAEMESDTVSNRSGGIFYGNDLFLYTGQLFDRKSAIAGRIYDRLELV